MTLCLKEAIEARDQVRIRTLLRERSHYVAELEQSGEALPPETMAAVQQARSNRRGRPFGEKVANNPAPPRDQFSQTRSQNLSSRLTDRSVI